MREERETTLSQHEDLPIAGTHINVRSQILKLNKVDLNNLDKCVTIKTEIHFLKTKDARYRWSDKWVLLYNLRSVCLFLSLKYVIP